METPAFTLVRTMAALAVVVSPSFVTPVAAGQPPANQPPRPAFTSSVDIVSVDVNVIDRNGRPVRDMSAGDFTLTVDGHVRKIASAQYVSVTIPEVTSEAPPADFSTNVGAPAGRLIAVVIDRGSIAPVRAKDVLAAAARFVGRLNALDRVALFSIPSGPTIDFTTDHQAIASALQQTDGQADPHPGSKGIGIADALAFDRGNGIAMDDVMARECGNVGQSELAICRRLVTEEAGIVATYAHERTRNTLAGLRAILERLGSSETPKTLVLVSEGLVIEGDRYATTGFSRAAAAAHATIYALEPEASEVDAAQARAPGSGARDRAFREEGLNFVTRAGGGELFRVVANPNFAFDRLASELSGYYLLGFEPEPGDRDGKPHAITVKVRRSDVALRSRLEFSVGPAGSKSDQQTITDLLRTPVLATDIPLKLTTYAFQDPESPKIRLLVAIDVEPSIDANGHMALGIVLVNASGAIGASFLQPAIEVQAQSAPKTQRYFATLLVDPGPYTLRAAVADSAGRRGSLERPIRAFMTRMSRFRVTELLIGDDDAEQPGGKVVPTVSGDMSGGFLHAYLELFSDAPTGFGGAEVAIELAASSGSAPLESVPAPLQLAGSDERCRAAAASVSIALLPAGSYVARAVISLDGRKIGQMTRPFRVVKPGS